jgi:hypothetical protein
MFFLPTELDELKRLREDQTLVKSNLYYSLYFYMLGEDVQEFLSTKGKMLSVFNEVEIEEIQSIAKKQHANFIYILSDIDNFDSSTDAAIDLYLILKNLNIKFFHYFLSSIEKTVFAIQVDYSIKQAFEKGEYSKMYMPVTVEQHFSKESSEKAFQKDLDKHGKKIAYRKRFTRKVLRHILLNSDEFRKAIEYESSVGESDSPPILENEKLYI